jgi:branched-chain amino acid transport system ATP-binding protein
MTPLLQISNVHVHYGKIAAVHNVSAVVEAGSIVTIIGANGAGKTSLLNAVAGLLPMQGEVSFDGQKLFGMSVEDRMERGLCLVPERRELFTSMTVQDNLLLGGFIHRRKRGLTGKLADVYDLFPRLRERRDQVAGTLSGGERQMLALGRALMSRPRLLMLDEPSLGLAPIVVREVFRIIAGLRTMGVSCLLVEQNARAALQTADYAYVMETGEVAFQGRAADLHADVRIVASFLGGT